MHARKVANRASADRPVPVVRRVSENPPAPAAEAAAAAAAAAVAASPPVPPTYFRLVVDGAEDDGGDFAKCAELIASVVEARLAYKKIDKGQQEDLITVEEVNALGMVAPQQASLGEDRERRSDSAAPPMRAAGAAAAAPSPSPSSESMGLAFEDGVFRVSGMRTELVAWSTYVADIQKLYQAIESGPCLSTARSRLTSLAHKFQLYALMNTELEANRGGASSSHGGAYVRCTKVDNALHMKTSVPAPVLLEFIRRAARELPNLPLLDVAEAAAILAAAGLADVSNVKHLSQHRGSEGNGESGSRHGRHSSTAFPPANGWKGGRFAGEQRLSYSDVGGGVASRNGSLASAAARHCMTLRQFLLAAGVVDAGVLTVEGLGLHPTLYRNKFLPYDMFSSQRNPSGAFGAKFLQALLSTDNDGPNRGDLCGSLIRTELEKREFKPRQAVVTEMLLDISGINEREVASLAAWTRRQGFNNFATNMWVLNIVPRFKKGFDAEGCAAAAVSSTFSSFSTGGGAPAATTVAARSVTTATAASAVSAPTSTLTPTCRTVGQQLRNIFYPLFMATLYPTDPDWSDVAQLLMHTSAVSIHTEATSRTQNLFSNPVHPDSIKISLAAPKHGDTVAATGAAAPAASATNAGGGKEVSDFYFFYYAWANVASLNALRARFGLNTLHFNPSIQEQAPAFDQLACSFLLADNVYHATSLSKCWIMQYLYMYARIGLVMSPLRDNALSVSFLDHPIIRYFQQGMQVSLSTSAPLHFHHRVDQPLLEEYSSLLKLRSLSPTDLCEMARNSVLNSNYPEHLKRKWLGETYTWIGCVGNDVARSNVCDARLQFRYESLAQEEAVLNRVLAKVAEAKSKPGASPVAAKVVCVIAAAASPLRAASPHGDSRLAASALETGTATIAAATVAAATARRLRAMASTDVLAEGDGSNVDGDALAVVGREGQQQRLRMARHTNPNAAAVIDTRVAFPRVKISFGNGLEDFGAFGFDHVVDDDPAAAVGVGGVGPAPVGVYAANGRRTGYATVASLRQVLLLRKKYIHTHAADVKVEDVFSPANQFDEDRWEFNSYYGVVLLSRVGKSAAWPQWIPPLQEFMRDLETVRQAASSTTLRRLAAHRLRLLEKRFQLHLSMNISREGGTRQEKEWNNRDFFTAHKVDTNVQMESGHNAHTLLEFVVEKATHHGDDVVGEDAAQNPVTLRTLLRHYEVQVETMTVDELHHILDTHEDLRSTFLSPHNYMQGRYFAELSKRTLALYQEDAYSFAENRLFLHGRSHDEWRQLSHWFDRYGMASSQSRWMVSIPREYAKLRASGEVKNFGEFLDNIFLPLWAISLRPATDTKLHYFLTHVSGFDCVASEESTVDATMSTTPPHGWRGETNPPYNYYLYYLWANITSLNEFRASRGLGTFAFRPQCGERGGLEHLIGGYLVANGINHGVTLAKHPVLEYVFYLAQIGIAMSPLSNTAAASAYLENPFPVYFQRGLNVSLATNTPLYFHFTREPLIEEYSIAAKLWQLEFNDLSEIARNSVLQCGFPPAWKAHALGPLYQLRSTLGNDVRRSRLSDIRVALRFECYHNELAFLDAQLVQPASATATAAAAAAAAEKRGGTPGSAAAATVARGQHLMPRAMWTLEEEMEIYRAAMAASRAHAGDGVGDVQPSPQERQPTLGDEAPGATAAPAGSEATGGQHNRHSNAGMPSPTQLARLLARGMSDELEDKANRGTGASAARPSQASASLCSEDDAEDDDDDDEDENEEEEAFAFNFGASGGCGCHAGHPSQSDPLLPPSEQQQQQPWQGGEAAPPAASAHAERRRRWQLIRRQQRELDRLEGELNQLAAISARLDSENSAVADMITQLRARLASEGLAILGGLAIGSKPAAVAEKAP